MIDKISSSSAMEFLNKYPVLKHLLLAGLFILGMIFITLLWLRVYTNHGQKLKMPDIQNKHVKDAAEIADDESFEIVVTDSVFLVGKPGGIVYKQNPQPGAMVKENRKIYVTLTKYDPDKISVRDLPILYGNDFSQKMTELEYRGLKSVIKDRKYDPGEPNHILEVYYKGQLIIDQNTLNESVKIDKGGTLEFVVSDSGGGEVTVPNVVCMTVAEAEFLLDQSKLGLGSVLKSGSIGKIEEAYIIAQIPPYDGITKIEMGKKVDITVSKTKSENCIN